MFPHRSGRHPRRPRVSRRFPGEKSEHSSLHATDKHLFFEFDGRGPTIQYSAICLYRHPLGVNFYVDMRKCQYIEIMEK